MKKPFNLKKFSKYLLSLVGYVFLVAADENFSPFAIPLLAANVYVGLSPLLSFALLVAAYLPSLSLSVVAVAAMSGAVVAIFFLITNKIGKKPNFSLAILTAVALVPYILMRDCHNLTVRLILAGVCVPLVFVFVSAAKVFLVKGLKYRLSTDEIVSAAALYSVASYGVINLFSAPVYECFAVGAILVSGMIMRRSCCSAVALISALPLFFNTENPAFFAPLALYSLAVTCFSPHSKLATAISVLAVKVALWNFTDVYDDWSFYPQLFILAPVCVYLFVPSRAFKKIREKLAVYKDNNLGKYALNRNRLDLAGKLFEISSVFDEMSASVKKLSEKTDVKEKAEKDLAEELFMTCCSDCKHLSSCRGNRFPSDEELRKIITLATAKGRLNLADLPSAFSVKCKYPESIVDETNELIARSERELLKAESLKNGRELILAQTDGLSEALKSLATNLSLRLDGRNETGNAISKNLMSAGIYAYETLAFGEGDGIEVNLLLPQKQVSSPLLLKAVKEVTGKNMVICDVFNVSEDLTAVTLKRAPLFDAAFSVAQKTKSDKEKSGDTHSLTKISEGKFLVALNDGMGSGEKASQTSATAISLVETFYKANLPSETVLSTVNKILSFNNEDNFTALDVGVIDLFSGGADFIKIGSPYSFVITRDAVKIVEGSSLPLGILDDLHPTVCKTKLDSGDVVVFVSDGISDAFGSSSDLIDFLSTQRALNPKTLADNILEKALALDGGIAKDDMTAFCVRIFEKAS